MMFTDMALSDGLERILPGRNYLFVYEGADRILRKIEVYSQKNKQAPAPTQQPAQQSTRQPTRQQARRTLQQEYEDRLQEVYEQQGEDEPQLPLRTA